MCKATVELGKYAAAAHDKKTALAMRQAAHNISLLHAVCKLPPEFTGTRPSTRHLHVMQKQKKKRSVEEDEATYATFYPAFRARSKRPRQIPVLFSHSAVDATPNPCAYADEQEREVWLRGMRLARQS